MEAIGIVISGLEDRANMSVSCGRIKCFTKRKYITNLFAVIADPFWDDDGAYSQPERCVVSIPSFTVAWFRSGLRSCRLQARNTTKVPL